MYSCQFARALTSKISTRLIYDKVMRRPEQEGYIKLTEVNSPGVPPFPNPPGFEELWS